MRERKDNKDIFEDYPVFKAMIKLGLPTVASMLVSVFYNMADTYFVAKTGDQNQISAVSLAFPIFSLLMGLGVIFGLGGSSLISRSLGAGDKERAKATSAFCFYALALMSVIITISALLALPFLVTVIGATEASSGHARDYLLVIMSGTIFVQMAGSLGNLIRAEGAAKEAMFGMMLGTVVNIILDPLMIMDFGLGWGVAGAAVATIIGNMCATGYFIWYFVRKSTVLSINPKHIRIKGIFGPVTAIGVPACLNNMLMSFSFMFYNNVMKEYGDGTIAAMGIVSRVMSLVMMVQAGISMGVGPLIGYNFGAKNYKRMKETILKTMLTTCTIGTAVSLVYYLFSADIIRMFIPDTEIVELGVKIMNAQLIAGPLIGIMFTMGGTLQAMGKGIFSLIVSLCRQGLVFIPMLIILNRSFGLNGIIYTQPVSDYFSLLISGTIVIFTMRGLLKEQNQREDRLPVLDPSANPEGEPADDKDEESRVSDDILQAVPENLPTDR